MAEDDGSSRPFVERRRILHNVGWDFIVRHWLELFAAGVLIGNTVGLVYLEIQS